MLEYSRKPEQNSEDNISEDELGAIASQYIHERRGL
jgi:hypothetical protein